MKSRQIPKEAQCMWCRGRKNKFGIEFRRHDYPDLHFRAFYLLTSAASHDLKETIDKDYCECGMPLETVRESEAPLKERSERV